MGFPSLHATFRMVVLFGALALGLVCTAARAEENPQQSPDKRLAALQERYDRQRKSLQIVVEGAEHRTGFIDENEAFRRYEDAVFAALMGEHESAAIEFTILLQAGAIKDVGFRQDAEWYLAEALFGMQNWTDAVEAYTHIKDQGPTNPFFSDAVRRLLEVHGITGNIVAFRAIFDQYVATHKVQGSELINYTLAKTFYRQKDWARSKSMFADFAPNSPYYGKAHYFIGTIHVIQGDLPEAEKEFKIATMAGLEESNRKEVLDLANLALGRIEYELGDYPAAIDAYLKVSKESPYFADQLYELVWTFIKQEEYEEAVRACDIFLLAFPEHKYTAQLKVLRGHLHMKEERYESALSTYEEVVKEYSPIRDLISSTDGSSDRARIFFEQLSGSDALEVLNQAGLPPYASEMLRSQPEVQKAVEMRASLDKETEELRSVRQVINDVEGAMVNGLSSLGTYRNARETVLWLDRDSLDLMAGLLAVEQDYLVGYVPADVKQRVRDALQQRVVVEEVADRTRSQGASDAERQTAMVDQVRALQSYALVVEQTAREGQSEADATENYLNQNLRGLTPAELQAMREQLDAARSDLGSSIGALRSKQGDGYTLKVLGDGGGTGVAVAQTDSSKELFANYTRIRAELRPFRMQVTQPGASQFFTQVDKLWDGISTFHSRSLETLSLLDASEKAEFTRLRQQVSGEATKVAGLQKDVSSASEETDILGAAAIRVGFQNLGQFFDSSVMRADMGIVDVYWLRKMQVTDRIDDLTREKVRLLKELDKRFQYINTRLEE